MADQNKAAPREFGEVIAYAIAAHKKGISADKIFTASPTDSNGYLAAFIREAIERHVAATDAVEAVRALPSICWWHPDGYPVFNNMNGADLILRDEAIAAVRATQPAEPAVPAVDAGAVAVEQAKPVCPWCEKAALELSCREDGTQNFQCSECLNFSHLLPLASQPQATPLEATSEQPKVEYTPGKWFDARTLDEMQAFYLSRLPAIREAAKEHGYAIGLHGSERRDFDLMAMQWREGASDKDALAHAIAVAACGIARDGAYQWEQKPNGRCAVSLPVCWTDHANPDFDKPSMGHIDLSVIDCAAAGMHAAAAFVDKRAADYLRDNASNEPDTGAVVFNCGEAGREYHSTLVELADDLRAAEGEATSERKPLTDAEIMTHYDGAIAEGGGHDNVILNMARAVEQHHGIGGGK